MMKKILNVAFIISLIFLLASCQEQEVVVDVFEMTFNDLSLRIPEEIDDDFELPELDDTELTVTYKVNDIEIENRIIQYQETLNDEILDLEVSISSSEETRTYHLIIIQLGIDVSDEDYFFQTVFDEIEGSIPNKIYSNLTLPESSFENVTLRYTSSCLNIVRNRVVYSFPVVEEVCPTLISVSYNGVTRTINKDFVFGVAADIPRLPEIHITTNYSAPIDSNSVYTEGSLTVESDASVLYSDITDASMKIRLRGNSTLYMPKLSYKIKFDEKTELLNDYAEKDWVLLANFSDQTLVRNAIAMNMSAKLDLAFTPSVTFVDLYINDEYQGNYMLTDQIEVTNDRVNIEENVTDIDTGYLVELDKGYDRDQEKLANENYFFSYALPFMIKSPQKEDEHYSEAQKAFINDYFDELFYTLMNGEDYNDLIDEASFIDWFIVNEVFKNVDSGYSSVYFYKDKGGKLFMGPVWDFDLSTGNPGHLQDELRGPMGWYTSRSDKNQIFELLMLYPGFRQNLKTRWNEVYEDTILPVLDDILEVSDSITYSRVQNFILWDVIGKNEDWYTAPEILEIESYDGQIWFLYDYLYARIIWLNQEINDF